jgi:ATP-dependent DNA helicase RecG
MTRSVQSEFVDGGAKKAAAAAPVRAGNLLPDAPVTELAGIGPTIASRLANVSVATVFDLATFFPRRYRALRELVAPDEQSLGELVRMTGEVRSVGLSWLPGRRAMVTITFACEDSSTFQAAFFNQPWLKKNYTVGQRRKVEGTLQKKGKRFVLQAAKVLPVGAVADGEVQLRYPEVEGVSSARMQQWIQLVLDGLHWQRVMLPELPVGLEELTLSPQQLLLAMHRPKDVAEHEHARRHFAVREAIKLFEAVERARRARQQRAAASFPVDDAMAERILQRIPYTLTDDQHQAVAALWRRLAGPGAMGVLLQGDVGTGKTAVAIAVSLAVCAKGKMVAFLAPTELLAEQHYASVSKWLKGTSVDVALHTATHCCKLPTAGARIVFGTHALLTGDDKLPGLGLVVVDEQHRFGVRQRMQLVHKGDNPHVLVMTATPIPRTMALVLFGDLDVVTLKSRPAGREAVRAFHVPAEKWSRVLRSIERAVKREGRVFVVCPAVGEEGEKGGVMRVHESLQKKFRCALVHGRVKASERQRALALFREGIVDVLVGTTVLEVGLDVPEATLVVIVSADRFGIATLHQVRGRVGRGRRRGIALLCGPRTDRVAAICATTNGFELAERDLALRGSGELLGTQQSGFSILRALDPVEDLELLLQVRKAVRSED